MGPENHGIGVVERNAGQPCGKAAQMAEADELAAVDVSRLPASALQRLGKYSATVDYKIPYGNAVLLKLAESSADGIPLAVFVSAPVMERLDLSRVYRNRDLPHGRGEGDPAPKLTVVGSFQPHAKAHRLSLDALEPSQISLR